MIESKDIEGRRTYDEALSLEDDGWRLPTIFELLEMQKEARGDGWFWSSSPYAGSANGAWFVYFSYGNVYASDKNYTYLARLVRAGQYFDHLHPVTKEEVTAFKSTGKLPSWHPPISESCIVIQKEKDKV